jgi:hypothetical protein
MSHQITKTKLLPIAVALLCILNACNSKNKKAKNADSSKSVKSDTIKYISKPLISSIYTADPSAHVFDGKIYIYPSHDINTGIPENDNGDHFAMRDYHILSMDSVSATIKDNGIGLDIKDIPWAGKQLWAPDAAYKNGVYYLYFPVKDKEGVFRIGVAESKSPAGPFKAGPKPMAGTYSIDPAVFTDTDGKTYMYFGGIWGGQLQRWISGSYDSTGSKTDSKQDGMPAISCKVAVLKPDMKEIDGKIKDVVILDSAGKPLLTSDHNRRFFEGSWMHKYNGKYYFTYSTGDTHFLCYAIGDSPLGPFFYKGIFMKPVQGWTTHHSIVEFKGKWYIFYHDTELSGKTHLRNIKVTALKHDADGSIKLIDPFIK